MSSTAILTVDLASLAANYRVLRGMVAKDVNVAGVVKANAYGLGMTEVMRVLEDEGCPLYFVANVDEASRARQVTDRPVASLAGISDREEAAYAAANHIWPVINSPDQLRFVPAGLPFILHLDTGMNRLGFSRDDYDVFVNRPNIKSFNIQMVMSHFACADEAGHPMTENQSRQFVDMAMRLDAAMGRAIPRSLANSSGMFRSDTYHHHLVRPGMALYGLNPTPENSNPMQPVVSVKAPVLQVRDVKAGETIGYGAGHQFAGNGKTATVALGYADGFLRQGGNGKCHVYWHGIACPVIGRISMDLVTIDLSGIPDNTPLPGLGDLIEVIGPHQDADTLAADVGTIGYEILTQLSTRAKRVYRS